MLYFLLFIFLFLCWFLEYLHIIPRYYARAIISKGWVIRQARPGLIMDVVRNPMPIGTMPVIPTVPVQIPELPVLTMDTIDVNSLPEMERFTVELKKDIYGLGITIAGYVCEKGNPLPRHARNTIRIISGEFEVEENKSLGDIRPLKENSIWIIFTLVKVERLKFGDERNFSFSLESPNHDPRS